MTTKHNHLYKLLAVANRELRQSRSGWCEADYREILRQCGASERDGRISAKTMTAVEMNQALKRFEQLGFVRRKPAGRPNRKGMQPRIAKLNAMWCALADAGVVRDRSEQAMRHWCENQVGTLTKFDWADGDDLNQAIEMLKAFARRCDVKLRG